jgi:hypothetical protein
MFYLVQRRMALQGVVKGEGEHGDAGLQQVWDDMKLGVGGRVRGLVLERLRMNCREGVVGRWQEVCLFLLFFPIHSFYLTRWLDREEGQLKLWRKEKMKLTILPGSSDNGTTLLYPRLNIRTLASCR